MRAFPLALVLAGTLAALGLVVHSMQRPRAPLPPRTVTADAGTNRLAAAARLRPPGEPLVPEFEVSAQHQMKRIRHKDAFGFCPLELVQTAQGVVTIQRTFTTNGVLLKEEAFLDGKPVPVPAE